MPNKTTYSWVVLTLVSVGCTQQSTPYIEVYNSRAALINSVEKSSNLAVIEFIQPANSAVTMGNFEQLSLNSYADFETKKVMAELAQLDRSTGKNVLGDNAVSYGATHLAADSISNIRNAYEARQKQINFVYNSSSAVMKNAGYAADAAAGYAAATGLGLAPALVIEVGKTLIMDVYGYAIEDIRAEEQTAATSFLVSAFKDVDAVDLKIWEDLTKLTSKQAYDEAFKMGLKLAASLTPANLPESEKARIEAGIAETLARTGISLLAQHKSLQLAVDANQSKQIVDAEQRLYSSTLTLQIFKQSTQDKFKALANAQADIQKSLLTQKELIDQNSGEIDDLKTRVKFTEDYIFSQMPVSRQIEMLEQGFYGDPKSTAVQKILANKAELRAKEVFQERFEAVLDGAQDLLVIAKFAKVNPKTIATVEKTSNLARIGMNTFKNLASGNYLGVVAGVLGAFGGGGKTAEQYNHEAVMKDLKFIKAELTEVKVLQKQTMEMIFKLSEQLQKSAERILSETARIYKMQLIQNQVLEEILNENFSSCLNIIELLKDDSWGKLLHQYSNRLANHLGPCATTIDRRLGLERDIPESPFLFSTYLRRSQAKEVSTSLDDDYYDALLSYLKVRGTTDLSEIVRSSLIPSGSSYDLFRKTKDLSGHVNSLENSVNTLGSRRVFAKAVLLQGQMIMQLLPGLIIYNNSSARQNDFIFSDQNVGKIEYMIIGNLINWTNIAITQESLIYGDATLNYLYAQMLELHSIKADTKILATTEAADTVATLDCDRDMRGPVCLLKRNSFLYSNLVKYALFKDLLNAGGSTTSWTAALAIADKDPSILNRLLKNDKWIFSKVEDKLLVHFLGLSMEVPDANLLFNGNLDKSSYLNPLLSLRDSLMHKVNEMQVNTYLSKDERQYLTYKLIWDQNAQK